MPDTPQGRGPGPPPPADVRWLKDIEPVHAGKTSPDDWYYAARGVSYGPVTQAQLRALARHDFYGPGDPVYCAHLRQWVRADSVHGLFDEVGRGDGEETARLCPPPSGFPPDAARLTDHAELEDKICAGLIDGAIVLALAVFPAWPAVFAFMALAGIIGRSSESLLPCLAGAWVAVGELYYASFESSAWQATPGKRRMEILVTDAEGNRLTFGRASLRFFASVASRLVFYGGYSNFGGRGEWRTLHDVIARTRVVYGSADRQPERQ